MSEKRQADSARLLYIEDAGNLLERIEGKPQRYARHHKQAFGTYRHRTAQVLIKQQRQHVQQDACYRPLPAMPRRAQDASGKPVVEADGAQQQR